MPRHQGSNDLRATGYEHASTPIIPSHNKENKIPRKTTESLQNRFTILRLSKQSSALASGGVVLAIN